MNTGVDGDVFRLMPVTVDACHLHWSIGDSIWRGGGGSHQRLHLCLLSPEHPKRVNYLQEVARRDDIASINCPILAGTRRVARSAAYLSIGHAWSVRCGEGRRLLSRPVQTAGID